MDIKGYMKYYKLLEQLKKDKTTVEFKYNPTTEGAYNVKIEGGKMPQGEVIEEASNNLHDLLSKIYANYKEKSK
ncbi:hypothetical protein [Clostridium sp.]|uniref:hypothetical protein n=1 Tax=Clostridium sp. TaxID=1506 RepID=UPI003F66C969